MFLTGDTVIYGAIGICRVDDIVESKLTGTLHKYYLLRPIDSDKNTIYVPLDNEKLVARMRTLPKKKQIIALIKETADEKIEWIDDTLDRAKAYHDILVDGDIKGNIKLMRTLHDRHILLSQAGKHLPKADDRIYKDCVKLVTAQLMHILSLEQDEVLALILRE